MLTKFAAFLHDVGDIYHMPTVHSHLRELDISPCHTQHLENLRCPSLESFTGAYASDDDCIFDMSFFISFLKRSQCPLKDLTITLDHDLTASDMGLICEGIPTLQCLNLQINPIPGALVTSFFIQLAEFSTVNGKEVPRYLQDLRSLSLHWVKDYSNWSALPNIFGNPTTGPLLNHRPALKLINISGHWDEDTPLDWLDNMDKDVLMRFLWLEEGGVKWDCFYKDNNRNRHSLIQDVRQHYNLMEELPE
ncbi:hypothetical protein BDN70DRAFT_335103 [Pholiota conissans]|uniref:Uncharacterized protein n=1 Tax=Pholiota conissans TaxID=109636 RepID=A0A9P6CP37_9AGAR|nr:hypothetical protein BDN70DRAFT_335103 [Pholiota conissans]